MLPPGHISIAYIAGRLIPKISLAATLVGGLLPDIDICLVFLPHFNQIHRLITHNLLFVILAASLAAVWATLVGHPRHRVFWGILLGGLIHLLLDACFDTNPSNGIGIALLWPFSSQYFSPFNLLALPGTTVTWHQPLAMVQQAFRYIWWEIPPCIVALVLRQRLNVR